MSERNLAWSLNMGMVEKTLAEWTRNLEAGESRIAVFEMIRDMPYEIIAELKDPIEGPARTLQAGRGSCTAKHFLLGRMFRLMEIPLQYVTYPFHWNDPGVAYPAVLRDMAEKVPVDFHLAIKARLEGKWVLVDATWDPPLRKVGFPVNLVWDGFSDTRNAVKPLEEIIHGNAVERAEYTAAAKQAYSEEETLAQDAFVVSLNRWLREVRGED